MIIEIFYLFTHLRENNTQMSNNIIIFVTNNILEPFSLCLNLSDITVLPLSTIFLANSKVFLLI